MVASGIWEEVLTWAHRLSHWISGLRCRWIASFVSVVTSFVLTARLKPETAAGEGHEAGGLRKDGIREIFGAFDETETWGFCCFILFVVMSQSFMHKSKARLPDIWNFWFELTISQITTFTRPCVATSFDQNNPDLFTNCILCRRIQNCFG